MLVLDVAVKNLDNLLALKDYLVKLGRKHADAGVPTSAFGVRRSHGSDSVQIISTVHNCIRAHPCDPVSDLVFVLRCFSGGGGVPPLHAAVRPGRGIQ